MYHKMSWLWQELGGAVPQTQKLESKSLKLVMPDCCCSEQEKKKTEQEDGDDFMMLLLLK